MKKLVAIVLVVALLVTHGNGFLCSAQELEDVGNGPLFEEGFCQEAFNYTDGEEIDAETFPLTIDQNVTEYTLAQGQSKTVHESEVWFICSSVRGAVDVSIMTTSPATIIVYKDNLFSDEVLYSYANSTTFKKTISDFSGSNSYRVYVSCGSSTTITCTINQHTDYAYNSQGGIWTPSIYSPTPNATALYYESIFYASPAYVAEVHAIVSNSTFLDYQEKYVKGVISLAEFVGHFFTKGTSKYLYGEKFASFLADISNAYDFKQVVLNNINEKGQYTGEQGGQRIYAKGVKLIRYINLNTGIQGYIVETWENNTMLTGQAGKIGTFDLFDIAYYSDVNSSTENYDSIMYLSSRNIMNGTNDPYFEPNVSMRRCDFALMLYRTSGSPSPGSLNNAVLLDVNSNTYFYDAIVWAVNNSLINGTDSYEQDEITYITFEPFNSIRRCDALLMMYRYAVERNLDDSTFNGTLMFPDSNQIPAYAETAVRWAIAQDIITNTNSSLQPMSSITRSTCAKWYATFCQHFSV